MKEENMFEISELVKLIAEARDAAFREGIKANSIIINKNLVKYPGGFFGFGTGNAVSCLPPMICGLEVHGTKTELPEDYAFAIFEATQTERERLIAETAKDILDEVDMLFNYVLSGTPLMINKPYVKKELRKIAEKHGVEFDAGTGHYSFDFSKKEWKED
jgi:hypothetical protein